MRKRSLWRPLFWRRRQAEEHVVNIPYFVESEDLQSTLTLNNNKTEQTSVAVTIFDSKGRPLAVAPITLEPMTPGRFKLRDLLKDAPGKFKEGNIQVLHDGSDMDVTTQTSIVSADKRLSFESTEVAAGDFASTRLDGIVWVPDHESQASVALTNTAPSTIINVTISKDQEQSTISLNPRETTVVDLKKFVPKVKNDPAALLVPVAMEMHKWEKTNV